MDTGTTAFMLCCNHRPHADDPRAGAVLRRHGLGRGSTNMMMTFDKWPRLVGVLWCLFGFSVTFGIPDRRIRRQHYHAGMKDMPNREPRSAGCR